MHEAFSAIVVPLDLEPAHDRSVAVAAGLAALGDLPIILLTVSSPGLPELADHIELERTAERHHLRRWSAVVLHDNDPARAVAAHLSTLDAPLVLISSEVRGVLSQLGSTDTTANLLAEISDPALVLGPNVPDTWPSAPAQLLCCIRPGGSADVTTPWTDRWLETFGGHKPTFVTVNRSDNSSGDVPRPTGDRSATPGVADEWKVVDNDDPVDGLLEFAEGSLDAVLVVTSERWTDESRLRRHSLARRLARTCANPVLVVPRELARGT